MPRLRVLAGPSPDALTPITTHVNTATPHTIRSDLFEGKVIVHVKGLTDEDGRVRESEYFSREERRGVTWSIQVQGRFLRSYSADDILFGNTFDRPLKLPWGAGAALKFMHYIDPTLEHDLTSQSKPWALSPLVSTMPHFAHSRHETSLQPQSARPPHPEASHIPRSPTTPERTPSFPPRRPLSDDTSQLFLALADDRWSASSGSTSGSDSGASTGYSSSSGSSKKSKILTSGSRLAHAIKRKASGRLADTSAEISGLRTAEQRRSYFSDTRRRKQVEFGPNDVITTDFCYGFLEFSPALSLKLPGGMSFDLMRYWDGQPVRFVCCERKVEEGGEPWGRTFWCVAIELAEDEEDEYEGDVD